MSYQSVPHNLRRLAVFALGSASVASLASAQATFSIDWHSPTVGVPDSITGTPITEGDILVPAGFVPAFGLLPAPGILISGGVTGLGLFGHAICVGHAGGTPCRIEVDALSYGTDHNMQPISGNVSGANYLFSTDEYSMGGVPPLNFPDLTSEFPVGDSSADVWIDGGGMPPGPLAPFAFPVGNTGYIDGDGMPSGSGAVYPGTGLLEPNFPGFPNAGDNLDALDWDQNGPFDIMPAGGVYFSLDAAFPGPFAPPNTGTALAHGFTGADILWTPAPGGPPVLWAPGPALGLNLINMQEDDLDALALWENGAPGFQPSSQPYDWLAAGGPDMVLFSVRRGSPVVGMPDSIFGIPIAEGDILTTPLPTALGGVSPFPGIFCAAENIGLSTARMGAFPDDLNALDTLKDVFTDCNGNGIDDSIDIATATSTDLNGNGVPDECEIIGGPYCYCPSVVAPCGNAYPIGGCRNSTGVGAILGGSGSGSVALDNLVLTTTQLPPGVPGLDFGGPLMAGPFPFGDGLRCVGGGITRFPPPAISSAAGVLTLGPGIAGTYGILPFTTVNFQCWYRNPPGPCGTGFNTSNAFSVTFTP